MPTRKQIVMEERKHIEIDFGKPVDMTKNIIKVVGVGGGGCNAVRNMYEEGITDVTFAVCNTDSKSLVSSPIPVKLMLGSTGLGAGAVPEKGRKEAEDSIDNIKTLFSDSTKMVFVTAGMGGGTGTGAAPIVAGVAKSMGLLTIGIVTIPFFFEKKKKIIKALKGVEEMRKNVDSLLIINNERLCDIYSDSRVSVKEAFKQADNILLNAVRSISELITIEGDIALDFCDVESTMRSGGGAIMAIGRAGGEHRIEKAIINALDSPLLYGSDILKAKRILFNIYTSEDSPLFVDEMAEIDAFMDELSSDIDVIWGVSDDNTLDEDAKIAILATGMDDGDSDFNVAKETVEDNEEYYYDALIKKLYKPKKKGEEERQNPNNIPIIIKSPIGENPYEEDGADGQSGNGTTDSSQSTQEEKQDTPSGTGEDSETGGKPSSEPDPNPTKSLADRLREHLKKIADTWLKEP